MAAEPRRVLTPQRASVRVTYGSQRTKVPSLSSSALQRTSTPIHETSGEPPRKRKEDLVDEEDGDDDGRQDTPSSKKRLVQTSLFSGCQPKAVNKPSKGHVEATFGRQGLDTMFPELSSSGKAPMPVTGFNDSDNWTMPSRKALRPRKHDDKIASLPAHDTAACRREQTFLDFGQKPLVPEPCQVCGMAFQRGREEDENLHNKFHRSWQQRQVRLLSWDIASRSAEEKTQIETVLYRNTSKSKSNSKQAKQPHDSMATIVLVDPQCCSKRDVQRALSILNIANEHLGAVKLSCDDLARSQRKILLYVSPRGFAEGCILAEAISSARRVAIEGTGTQSAEPAIRLLDNEEAAVCGISRIWVASDARRRGVASQMIDVLCRRFVYGCQLSRDSLAFTQPTSDGRSLAEKVFGRSDFLAYIEDY